MKRTIHGENLDERWGGGWTARARFSTRDAWCPACGARPHRKCQETADDRAEQARAREVDLLLAAYGHKVPRRDGRIHDHPARVWRAEALTKLAREGAAALFALAAKRTVATCNERRLTDNFGPLFSQEA